MSRGIIQISTIEQFTWSNSATLGLIVVVPCASGSGVIKLFNSPNLLFLQLAESFLCANGNASNFKEDVKSENVLLKNGEMGLKILGLPGLAGIDVS